MLGSIELRGGGVWRSVCVLDDRGRLMRIVCGP